MRGSSTTPRRLPGYPLAALEPKVGANLVGTDTVRCGGKALQQVESSSAAEDLRTSGEFGIGGAHIRSPMVWRVYRREPRTGSPP